jgi:dipeptidyl-peptidase 4
MIPDMTELESSLIRQATVTPQWLSGNQAFWYLREDGLGGSQFILVDCATGLRQAAFDHDGLARELGKQTEQIIEPHRLPFWWINVAQDGSWMRFQFDGHTWQYERNDKLELWDGDLDMGDFDDASDEGASPWSRQKSSITFANHTTHSITYSWMDNEGSARYYGIVVAGQSRTQESYAGHVWRLTVEDSEKKIACTVKDRHATAVIGELPDRLTLNWQSDVWGGENRSAKLDGSVPTKAGPEIFVRDYNAWIRHVDGTEEPLSHGASVDGSFKEDYIYPSSAQQYAVMWQCEPESEHIVHMVDSSPEDQLQPKLKSIQYLKPGDNVEVCRPRLFDLGVRKEICVDNRLFNNPYVLVNIGWSEDDTKYRFIYNERGHKRVRLLEINLSGNVRILAENRSETFVDYHHKLYYKIIESRGEFLWASERDGWNHLYLYDLTDGSVKNQITQGEWVMRSVEAIDLERGLIWFTCLGLVPGQDPYYAHLACIGFDGSGLRIVTDGDGTHTWKWSPGRRFLIDSWSRVDLPPHTVLRKAQTGEMIASLEQNPLDILVEAGWSCPEIFMAPGRDGQTMIHGVIIRPASFDASKSYPILERIYAGPQGYYTPKAFQPLAKLRQRANQGYIIVLMDGMGTNWRSKAFHDVCYKNLKDAGLPDRIAWIRKAAETRPWMDISRVGCYGSSAGGQNAAAAVLHHGDFYKAACASAGSHDNRMDKLWWNELWMGHPVDESYRESSNVTHAHKLRSALMLVVGELDTNVDPSSTLQLANSLIKADKDFELVFVPGGDHHVSTLPYVEKKQDCFFRKYLKPV